MHVEDPLFKDIVMEESERYFNQGSTLKTVASFLSINDVKGAIQRAIRTNELYLAYFMAKNLFKEAVPEVALMLCEKAERFFMMDVCQKLLLEVGNKRQEALFRSRWVAMGLLPKK